MESSLLSLVILFVVVAVAPLVADVLGRLITVPLVVVEIVLGLLVGPDVLGWLQPGELTNTLATFGVAMLFFLAGSEIDLAAIKGKPIMRAGMSWVLSLGMAMIGGVLLAPSPSAGIFVAICLTSTALGTIMPVLRDANEINTPFGRLVIAAGAIGQFGPLLALALFLSGRHPLVSAIALTAFTAVIALAMWWASHGLPSWLRRIMSGTMRTSGQFAVRLVIAVLVVLSCASMALGLDMLIGAFAAGALARVLLGSVAPAERETIDRKLEAVGFGFLVPIFFVMTGVRFDLAALLSDPQTLLLIPIFLGLFLVVRGLPSLIGAPAGSTWSDRGAMVLLTSTALAIVVAVTNIGVEAGALSTAMASALVGAGLFSVLLFPLFALLLRRRSEERPTNAGASTALPDGTNARPDGPASAEQ